MCKKTFKYVNEIEKKWVTSYTIQVRIDSGKKWNSLGKFTGNHDRLTEVVHPLDSRIYVRYVRFIPKTYCNYPGLQVSLFGPDISKNKNIIDKMINFNRPNKAGIFAF